MNDNLGGCVSELNIKYSKVVLQICPQGVDADCSFAVTVDDHNVVGGQSDQTADVARLHGTIQAPRTAAILAISKSRPGSPYNSQYLLMQAPRAPARGAVGSLIHASRVLTQNLHHQICHLSSFSARRGLESTMLVSRDRSWHGFGRNVEEVTHERAGFGPCLATVRNIFTLNQSQSERLRRLACRLQPRVENDYSL